MKICGIIVEDVDHQLGTFKEEESWMRILRRIVSYIFRCLVVTTRDKCGFRRDLRIYIYCIVILNFYINKSAPFI